jgi:hypothetical protein
VNPNLVAEGEGAIQLPHLARVAGEFDQFHLAIMEDQMLRCVRDVHIPSTRAVAAFDQHEVGGGIRHRV